MARAMGPFKRTGTNPEWARPVIKALSLIHMGNPNDRVWVSELDTFCVVTFDTAQKPSTLYVIERYPEDLDIDRVLS